jgi:hypothetical protein
LSIIHAVVDVSKCLIGVPRLLQSIDRRYIPHHYTTEIVLSYDRGNDIGERFRSNIARSSSGCRARDANKNFDVFIGRSPGCPTLPGVVIESTTLDTARRVVIKLNVRPGKNKVWHLNENHAISLAFIFCGAYSKLELSKASPREASGKTHLSAVRRDW